MIMKKIFYSIFALSLILSTSCTLTSCSDFFEPETDDELDGESYISSNTEMYTGFLGIMTKVQAVGDKQILLTDTRAELLEPTENSNPELIALYNYDTNLVGNSYADPAGYYEVVIAVNDYLAKMKEYRYVTGVDQEVWQDLVSSAVRVKAWAYKTLGEIYGKAIWFDDPLIKVTDITEENGFKLMDISELTDRNLRLMEEGFDGVATNRTIDWIAWIDPSNINSISSSQYRKWNTMVPAYEGLYAELNLWKGACLDAQGQDAKVYYKKAADVLLSILTNYANLNYPGGNPTQDPGSTVYWLPSAATPGKYKTIWDNADPYPMETAAAIIYDYTKNQTNTLLKHFSNEYPNKYWLRPSEVGMNRYIDGQFNPGTNTNDTRYKCMFGESSGQPYIAKFRPVGSSKRVQPYQDDVHIYVYRATQYHMMLAEALNHLLRFTAMDGVLNMGVLKTIYVATSPEWEGFSRNWTGDAEWGTRKYPSAGIRGCFELQARPVKTSIIELGEKNTLRFNDLAILDEVMLEFACEGKTYGFMNRMAVRHNDPAIVADRVCPKYEGTGKEAHVRSQIMAGGYWVNYPLN